MASLKGTGTNDKKKVAIAAALGLVVLLLAFKTIFGGPEPVPAPPSVPVRPSAIAVAPAGAGGASSTGSAAGSMDPQLHPGLMAENENYMYHGSGRNIFSPGSVAAAPVAIERPKGPVHPAMVAAAAVINQGPPPPPAIDLRFFGYSARKSGMRRAFFLHGDDVFVASEGDVVSHRYRVVRIGPSNAEIEDLPYHNTQTLPLVQVPN